MNTQRLKDLRKDKHHMTQAEAAKRLGIALTTYDSYEQGHRQPDPDMLVKIATLFDTSVDYIIGTGSGATSDDDGPKLVIADDYIKVYGEIHAGEAVRNDAPFETNHSMICNAVLAHHINMPIWTARKKPTGWQDADKKISPKAYFTISTLY